MIKGWPVGSIILGLGINMEVLALKGYVPFYLATALFFLSITLNLSTSKLAARS